MYGMPQPNTYGQYGFGGYGGFPKKAATAASPGGAAPGMTSPASATVGMGMGAGAQTGAVDPSAATGQAAQGQWAGADPNSYYSNYWGGKFCLPLGRFTLLTELTQDTTVSKPLV